ncbi:CBS domain-containing protein [Telmatospirillum sp. J64-1]|uniref:CBS domain-containing protein n=1 Tax=Telmatospirillum sp. J64-1 TaxID=2502183 RepID=UPI00115EE5DD|nr:CBS domain-containing protein [Telmatospirillum sp. J64-1]
MLVNTILAAKGRRVETIGPDASVAEAASKLWGAKIGAMVVLEGERIVGIISERDIVRGMALTGPDVGQRPVRDLMTTQVQTCSPDARVEDLMSTMTSRRIRHLPVVEDGKMVGIISIGDIVKNRLDEATMEVQELRHYVVSSR